MNTGSPDKQGNYNRYNDTYKSNIFDNRGEGSAAQQYKYESPIKTGSMLNTVGRRNGTSSGNKSET